MKQADSMNRSDDLDGVAVHEKIWTKLYLGHTTFGFVGHRRRWYILSSTVESPRKNANPRTGPMESK